MKTGNQMKTAALALAISGLCVWQAGAVVSYNIDLNFGGETISGALNGTDLGGGQFVVTSGTETFSGPISGTFDIIANPNAPNITGNYGYNYDDLLLTTPGADPILTTGGLLWLNSANNDVANLWGNGYQNYSLYDNINGYVINGPMSAGISNGTATFAAVPEAGMFAVAGVALLGLVYAGRVYSERTKLA